MVLVAIIEALLPQFHFITFIFMGTEIIIQVTCTCGLIYFGNNTIKILKQSGNLSQQHNVVARKVIIFVFCYVFFSVTGVIIWAGSPMGYVMSVMFALFCTCILNFAAVFVLFLPPIIERRKKQRRLALAERSLANGVCPSPTSSNPHTPPAPIEFEIRAGNI